MALHKSSPIILRVIRYYAIPIGPESDAEFDRICDEFGVDLFVAASQFLIEQGIITESTADFPHNEILTEQGLEVLAAMDEAKPKEPEVPQFYHLVLSRTEIEYLAIGGAANAGVISQNNRYLRVWHASLEKWQLDQLLAGRQPGIINNEVTEKIAKLLGIEACPDCGYFHHEGEHV